MTEHKFKLAPYNEEEAKTVLADIESVLTKHNGHFVVAPTINPDGTLGAKLEVFKKVEAREEGVPTPFIENGEETPKEV